MLYRFFRHGSGASLERRTKAGFEPILRAKLLAIDPMKRRAIAKNKTAHIAKSKAEWP
jgi:hypothetical protein